MLRIVARRQRSHGCRYTSGRLRTKHRGDWLYGRVEVRARLPPSRRGLWPAIWMLPTDDAFGGWPHSGEIDLVEHVGWEADGLLHAAAHATRHNPCAGPGADMPWPRPPDGASLLLDARRGGVF